MFFEFHIWEKSKLIDNYFKKRFAADIVITPISFMRSHTITNGKVEVKCTRVEFNDGTKVIATDQYTAFVNAYKAFLEGLKDKELPSAN